MRKDFHEDYRRERLQPPSERSTGLVFAGVAALVGVFHYDTVAVWLPCLVLALALAAVSWRAPKLLCWPNLVWFRFSLLLSRLVNPVVMAILFGLVIVPAGLVMRLARDPLRRRRSAQAATYWVERGEAPQPTSMHNQF